MMFASAPLSPARANLLLVLAALFWGLGGVPQKTVLEHLDPLTAAGLRGMLGAALLMPFALCGPRMALRDLGGLARVTLWFALGLTLQQAAYRDATVTNATFLVAAGVILTPSLVWLLHGERPEPGLTTRASLTVLGLGLMIGGSGSVARGDLLALASAAAYAMRAIALVSHLRAGGSVMMAITAQFAVVGVLVLPAGLWLGAPSSEAIWAAAPDLLVLAMFPTVLAFLLQALALRAVGPSHAALMVSFQSIAGALGAVLLLGERPSLTVLCGGAVLLSALAWAGWPRVPHVPA